MNTVTVKVDELSGEALDWAITWHYPLVSGIKWVGVQDDEKRSNLKEDFGPTVEIPAELAKGS